MTGNPVLSLLSYTIDSFRGKLQAEIDFALLKAMACLHNISALNLSQKLVDMVAVPSWASAADALALWAPVFLCKFCTNCGRHKIDYLCHTNNNEPAPLIISSHKAMK